MESLFISHVTLKSDEKWNMLQFEQTLLCLQKLSAVKLLRCAAAEQLVCIVALMQ